MDNKKNKIYISTLVVFWVLFASSITALLNILVMNLIDLFSRVLFYSSAFALPCLGIALVVLAVKANFTKISKIFFILTGASAIGIAASAMLHNLVYALFIKLFGEGFWAGTGDEPVFFILAVILCPLALLAGTVGSIVLIAKKRIIPQ
jgi:hypothetical protein